MTFSNDKNILTICLEGRIDTSNASKTEEELNSIVSSNEHEQLVLDLEKVDFVSSAGLRVFLRCKQSSPSLSIINVCSDVYEVFEMTGFTEIIDIQKAYRQISIEGCEVIGKGAVGIVYRISEDTIAKVYYHPDTTMDDIKRERELSHRAFVMGIPTAISYDVVKAGDKFATIYELLNCDTLKGLIAKDPEHLDKYAEMYADLLKKLHSCKVNPGELPSMKQVDSAFVEIVGDSLPDGLGRKYLNMLSEIPDDLNVCHGDCHIKNIMVQNGEALLIDMDTLTHGNQIYDFARAYNTYFGYTELLDQQKDHFIGLPYDLLKELYRLTVKKYFNTNDDLRVQYLMDKFRIVGIGYLYAKCLRNPKFKQKAGDANFSRMEETFIGLLRRIDNLLL